MKKSAIEQDQLNAFLHQYLSENRPDMDENTRSTVHGLGEDTVQGIDALKYLTGGKKHQVETFYDKHPVQAVGQDVVESLPALGGAAIAGTAGHSMLKDYLTNRKINKSRSGEGKEHKSHEGVSSKHVVEGKLPDVYEEMHAKLSPGKQHLGSLSDAHIARMMSKEFPSKSLPHGESASTGKLKNMIQHLFNRNSADSERLAGGVAERISRPNHEFEIPKKEFSAFGKKFNVGGKINSGISKNLTSHFNPKVLAGGGGAIAGGMALSPIVKFLQRSVYGDKKVQEWKKNQNMTHGKF